MRVLVIEDDDDLAAAVVAGLRADHLAVDRTGDVDAAVDLLAATSYDVVCLDLGLPDGDGLDLCRRMHSGELVRPGSIIIVTARDAVDARVVGLDAGADDYLVKPFSIAELRARIRALTRRGRHDPNELTVAAIALDPAGHRATRRGHDLDLTGREFSVLRYLMVRHGEVVSAEDLLEHCWDAHADPFTGSVRVIVSRLRHKLGTPPPIETVRGVGYRLVDVR